MGRMFVQILSLGAAIGIAACGQAPATAPAEQPVVATSEAVNIAPTPITPSATPAAANSDQSQEDSAMPQRPSDPQNTSPNVNPALAPLVDQARADLAARLSIAADQIETIEAQAVIWPDGSIGCPEPGVNYMQVLTEGAFISLRASGTIYNYHSGRGREPFYCASSGGAPTPMNGGAGDI
ncbi:MAG: hypothetical protein HC822_11105 [Oscillochloris sp.]|nr:hypothetical protein [Oscillochloris sp.]